MLSRIIALTLSAHSFLGKKASWCQMNKFLESQLIFQYFKYFYNNFNLCNINKWSL
jgi:hypothetical protein